jgi:hypothetical protein
MSSSMTMMVITVMVVMMVMAAIIIAMTGLAMSPDLPSGTPAVARAAGGRLPAGSCTTAMSLKFKGIISGH